MSPKPYTCNASYNVTYNIAYNVTYNVAYYVTYNIGYNVAYNVTYNIAYYVTYNVAYYIAYHNYDDNNYCSILWEVVPMPNIQTLRTVFAMQIQQVVTTSMSILPMLEEALLVARLSLGAGTPCEEYQSHNTLMPSSTGVQ
ncbi:uncharacterized protein LOC121384980 [Gigantopelta aegis]|uniref:uncharacterized protein LOC121384980 n=1 Tax=Gigantopelta aegis TaxID=1735272 RepID=UPI001B88A466|nr:uncharacterized protein LOC121384980 [Gigantopelta aegis]